MMNRLTVGYLMRIAFKLGWYARDRYPGDDYDEVARKFSLHVDKLISDEMIARQQGTSTWSKYGH